MFNMLFIHRTVIDKKSYTFPFKNSSLHSMLQNPLDTLLKQVDIFYVGFKFKDFFSINKQITIISIIMQTQAKFSVCFAKINTEFFL